MLNGFKELLLIRDIPNINNFNNDIVIYKDIKDEINYFKKDAQNDEIFNQEEEINKYKFLELNKYHHQYLLLQKKILLIIF